MSRHRYLYGNANPVMYVDPSGLFSITFSDQSLSSAIITALNAIPNAVPIGMLANIGRVGAAGAVIAGSLGLLNRLRKSEFHHWEGNLTSTVGTSILPFSWFKIAELRSSTTQKESNFWIVPIVLPSAFMPQFKVGGGWFVGKTPVEVFAKSFGEPSSRDLAGPYIGPVFSIRLPNPNLPTESPLWKLPYDPVFYMGWAGYGKATGPTEGNGILFAFGADVGLSIPVS